jgi:hypothetical protein
MNLGENFPDHISFVRDFQNHRFKKNMSHCAGQGIVNTHVGFMLWLEPG